MSDDFAKFLFLGTMILIVFVSNRATIYQEADILKPRLAASLAGSAQKEPPLFILEPPNEKKEERSEKREEAGRNVEPVAVTPPVALENTPTAAPAPRIAQGGDINLPKVNAAAALVADLLDEKIFFKLFADRRWPVASITKLVSAVVVSKNFPMHETITISAENPLFQESENFLKEGEKYSVQDLMAVMLLRSSNRAAEALAGFWGRSRFIQAMNRLMDEWGLKETRFDDPTGLSASNQSTAADLLHLAKNIYEKHPEIFQITRRESVTITEINSGRRTIIKNINLFAGKDYFMGGKTGYTDEAGGNLLSVFNYGNRPLFIVVLGTDDRFGETERLWEWFKRNNY